MQINLNEQEIETLMESLEYSKQHVADAKDTPYTIRQENLENIDAVRSKIREAGNPPAPPSKP